MLIFSFVQTYLNHSNCMQYKQFEWYHVLQCSSYETRSMQSGCAVQPKWCSVQPDISRSYLLADIIHRDYNGGLSKNWSKKYSKKLQILSLVFNDNQSPSVPVTDLGNNWLTVSINSGRSIGQRSRSIVKEKRETFEQSPGSELSLSLAVNEMYLYLYGGATSTRKKTTGQMTNSSNATYVFWPKPR